MDDVKKYVTLTFTDTCPVAAAIVRSTGDVETIQKRALKRFGDLGLSSDHFHPQDPARMLNGGQISNGKYTYETRIEAGIAAALKTSGNENVVRIGEADTPLRPASVPRQTYKGLRLVK
jgi:hypothetical protein